MFFYRVIKACKRFLVRLLNEDPANDYEAAIFQAVRTVVATFGRGPSNVVR